MSNDLEALYVDMRKGVELIPRRRVETVWDRLKAPLRIGQRVWWYFQEDAKLARKSGLKPQDCARYSGIIIPQPGCDCRSQMEPEDAIVVHDWYPFEKHHSSVQYTTLIRLLLAPGLVEIFLRGHNQNPAEIHLAEINPRFKYDCGHCKVNWCCGELCACENKSLSKDWIKTPLSRQRQVVRWQAEQQKYFYLPDAPDKFEKYTALKARVLKSRQKWYAKHPEFPSYENHQKG